MATAKKKRKNTGHKIVHPEDRSPYRYVWISLLLFFFSVSILISEISYLSNWQADASLISVPLSSDVHALNSCGLLGAKLSDILIRQYLGIAAFLIPYTLLMASISLAFIKYKWPRRRLLPSVIFLCFISLFLGGFWGRDDAFFGSGIGGEMGIYIAEWIKGYLGPEGTSVLLLIIAALLIWAFAAREVLWLTRKSLTGITISCRALGAAANKLKVSHTPTQPLEPAPQPLEPEPQPHEPEQQPLEPEPQPLEPEPQPLEPEPQPLEPEPQPAFQNYEQLNTILLDNGQLAAVITDNFYLYLDIDTLRKMPQDKTEEITHTEEDPDIFVIKRNTEPQIIEPQTIEPQVVEPQVAEPQTAEPQTIEQQVAEPQTAEPQEDEQQEDEPQVIVPQYDEVENQSKTIVDGLVISKMDAEMKVSDKDVDERPLYDPTYELKYYHKPSVDLLKKYDETEVMVKDDEVVKNKNQIVETLATFGIKISEIEATVGPTVTLYEIKPAPGVRISKIQNLEKDIALALAALGIRIIAPIPGKSVIGIEVPNRNKATVSMYSVIKSTKFHESTAELPIALGKTIQNETLVLDLAKMPHLLVAGATGQGKSVGLNAIITSLLYKKHPAELKFVMVDPKRLELTPYAALAKHFMAQMEGSDSIILTDTEKVVYTLNSICREMDDRYKLLEDAGVKNLKEYNDKFIHRRLNPEKGHRFLPYIVVIVDEFADLIMTAGREIETPIARIAQLARAAGIHMIIATQRPTTNIITGTIKANFPARIAFRVTSFMDSRTILDKGGADQLIGRGDMLVQSGSDLIRVQCAFVDTPEVESITKFIGAQQGYLEPYQLPEYQPESDSKDGYSQDTGSMQIDPLLVEVARFVVDNQIGSTSKIQRNFEIGFNRAGRIVDQLESIGIVGKQCGSKPRQVLINDPVYLEHILEKIK